MKVYKLVKENDLVRRVWTQLGDTDTVRGDKPFGKSLALSGDGMTLAVGGTNLCEFGKTVSTYLLSRRMRGSHNNEFQH